MSQQLSLRFEAMDAIEESDQDQLLPADGAANDIEEDADSSLYVERLSAVRAVVGAFQHAAEDREKQNELLVLINKMKNDELNEVRAELANQLADLALLCADWLTRDDYYRRVIHDYVFKMFYSLIFDNESSVRERCRDSCLRMVASGNEQLIDLVIINFLVPTVRDLIEGGQLDHIRIEGLDLMMDMQPARELFITHFLEPYESMLRDVSFTVRRASGVKLPLVLKLVTWQVFETTLLPRLQQLCHDNVWGVRRSMPQTIVSICQLSSHTAHDECLIPLYATLLKDHSKFVRQSAYENLGTMIYATRREEIQVASPISGRSTGSDLIVSEEQSSNELMKALQENSEDNAIKAPLAAMDDSGSPQPSPDIMFEHRSMSATGSRSENRHKKRPQSHSPQVQIRVMTDDSEKRATPVSSSAEPMEGANSSVAPTTTSEAQALTTKLYSATSVRTHETNGPVSPVLLRAYLEMTQVDPEVPLDDMSYHCAFSFPAVVVAMGVSHWPVLRETFFKLCQDTDWRVRCKMAVQIHELGFILGRETTHADLLEVAYQFTNDLDEIRYNAVKNVGAFINLLHGRPKTEFIARLRNFIKVENPKYWRFRETFATQLAHVVKHKKTKSDDTKNHIWPLVQDLATDRVLAVRLKAFHLVAILLNLARTKKLTQFAASILDFVRHTFVEAPSSTGKVAFAHLSECLVEQLEYNWFVTHFGNALLQLADSKVLNVQIAVSRSMAIINGKRIKKLESRSAREFDKRSSEIRSRLENSCVYCKFR